jgi:hypothetical protein
MGMLLKIKSEGPDWNPKRLKQLYHKNLPPLEDLPEYFVKLRNSNKLRRV